jgi:hypothetical protein
VGAAGDEQERIARNEAAFRRVNESLEAERPPADPGRALPFVCECAKLGCTAPVELTAAEYEELRGHPRRFIVADGHVAPGEIVVARHGDHLIVEKAGEAGAIAAELDPRG